jgi:hypothetical protein
MHLRVDWSSKVFIIVSNQSAVVGVYIYIYIYMETYLTARSMDNFKQRKLLLWQLKCLLRRKLLRLTYVLLNLPWKQRHSSTMSKRRWVNTNVGYTLTHFKHCHCMSTPFADWDTAVGMSTRYGRDFRARSDWLWDSAGVLYNGSQG